jgi:hypothetical protein
MSGIYFRTRSGDEARLQGSERAWFSHLANHQAYIALELIPQFHDFDTPDRPHLLREVVASPTHWSLNSRGHEFAKQMRTALNVGRDLRFKTPHGDIGSWYIVLNTALAAGSDPVKLGARLHAQCELHCWVDGPNRAWLADIIERGLKTGIFREGLRWDAVVELLRSADDEAVVMDYSVTESFPRRDMDPESAGYDQETGEDLWYELPHEERWDRCMALLRAEEHPGFGDEISPENWDGFHFGEEFNGYQLMDYARTLREAKETLDP